jgi:hypothetical protein
MPDINPFASTQVAYRINNPGVCVGFEQISIGAAVASLTLSVCSQTPRYAIMYLESNAVVIAARYLLTGANPTTTVGMPKLDGSAWDIISTQDLIRFRITGVPAAATTTLNVEYYA